jgi:hypothetical protein
MNSLCKHAVNSLGFVYYLIWKKHGAVMFFASMLRSRKPVFLLFFFPLAVSYFWGICVGFECYVCQIPSLHTDVASYWEKSENHSYLTVHV